MHAADVLSGVGTQTAQALRLPFTQLQLNRQFFRYSDVLFHVLLVPACCRWPALHEEA
jgi:hypothetical protein